MPDLAQPLKWDAYFLNLAEAVKLRSSCSRRQVGAVIVRDHRLLSTGYNGTPKGIKNCNEGGCPRCAGTTPSGEGFSECLCVHAEINAIAQAARFGTMIDNSVLYCTLFPCKDCAKAMINDGIISVVVGSTDYNQASVQAAGGLLHEAGIRVQVGAEPPPAIYGPGPRGLRTLQ